MLFLLMVHRVRTGLCRNDIGNMQFAEDVCKGQAALLEEWAPVEETFRSCFKIPGEFPSASEKVAVKAGKSAHIQCIVAARPSPLLGGFDQRRPALLQPREDRWGF